MAFNFDEWAQLAKHDKAAFEQKRQKALKQAIDECAGSEKELRMLNGLQFRIDMIRRRHKTPLAACIVLSNMLMDHVYQLVNPDVDAILEQANSPDQVSTSTCKIIPFDPLRRPPELS